MKIHFKAESNGTEFSECNYYIKATLTAIPAKVTCKRCQGTKAYKEMME